jgi:hypothetical protein
MTPGEDGDPDWVEISVACGEHMITYCVEAKWSLLQWDKIDAGLRGHWEMMVQVKNHRNTKGNQLQILSF